MLLELLLLGLGGDLVGDRRGDDHHAVLVADDHVAGHDRHAGAGDRHLVIDRHVHPAERRAVRAAVVDGDVEPAQRGGVAHGAVGDDADRPELDRPHREDVADRARLGLVAGVDHQHLARLQRLDRGALRVEPRCVRLDEVLADRHEAQRPGPPDHPLPGFDRRQPRHERRAHAALLQHGRQRGGRDRFESAARVGVDVGRRIVAHLLADSFLRDDRFDAAPTVVASSCRAVAATVASGVAADGRADEPGKMNREDERDRIGQHPRQPGDSSRGPALPHRRRPATSTASTSRTRRGARTCARRTRTPRSSRSTCRTRHRRRACCACSPPPISPG